MPFAVSVLRNFSCAFFALLIALAPYSPAGGATLESRQSPTREAVVRALEARGVDAASAAARAAALTDEEAATLAARIDELPAGGALDLTEYAVVGFKILLALTVFGFILFVILKGSESDDAPPAQ
jgi:hypothetical protein